MHDTSQCHRLFKHLIRCFVITACSVSDSSDQLRTPMSERTNFLGCFIIVSCLCSCASTVTDILTRNHGKFIIQAAHSIRALTCVPRTDSNTLISERSPDSNLVNGRTTSATFLFGQKIIFTTFLFLESFLFLIKKILVNVLPNYDWLLSVYWRYYNESFSQVR